MQKATPEVLEPLELTDLLEDEDLELCGANGTKVMAQNPYSPLPPPTPAVGAHPSYFPVTFPSQYPAAPPKSSQGVLFAALALGAMLVLGAAVVGGAVVYRFKRDSAKAAAVTTPTPTVTETSTSTAQPTTTAAPLATTDVTTTTTVATIAPPPHAVVRPTGTGTLRTFAVATGMPVYVDGRQVGVGGPRIVTVCGKHTVVVGSGKPKSVDIPCNGSPLTVGTPDGR